MPIRFAGSNAKRSPMQPHAVETLRGEVDQPLGKTAFYDLLFVLCEVLDEAIRSGNCYVLLGATRDQSTYTLTVSINGEKRTVYASQGLGDLLTQAAALLSS